MPVSSVPLPRILATAGRGLARILRLGNRDTSGPAQITGPTRSAEWQRLQAERHDLIHQREIAVRRHRRRSGIDARLREITERLLELEGR